MTLVVQGLRKSFSGLCVVDDVSFEAAAEGITGLIGPNGAGKSTLFALVTGVPGGGCRDASALAASPIEGTDGPGAGAAGAAARTFQVPRPFADLSVREKPDGGGTPRSPVNT